jgi:hypothetical protein
MELEHRGSQKSKHPANDGAGVRRVHRKEMRTVAAGRAGRCIVRAQVTGPVTDKWPTARPALDITLRSISDGFLFFPLISDPVERASVSTFSFTRISVTCAREMGSDSNAKAVIAERNRKKTDAKKRNQQVRALRLRALRPGPEPGVGRASASTVSTCVTRQRRLVAGPEERPLLRTGPELGARVLNQISAKACENCCSAGPGFLLRRIDAPAP